MEDRQIDKNSQPRCWAGLIVLRVRTQALLFEELLYFLVFYDFLLEDVSTGFWAFNHLNALRVVTSGVAGVKCCNRFLCHCLISF